jgi:hypothetical protein
VTSRPVCPECATPVEVDWEWCHGCGFDPEGKLAEARANGLEPAVLAPSSAVPPAVAFPGAAPPQPLMASPLPAPRAADRAAPSPGSPPVAAAPPVPLPDVSPLSDADSWDDEAWGSDVLVPSGDADAMTAGVTNGLDTSRADGDVAAGDAFGSADELVSAKPSAFLADGPTPAPGPPPSPSGFSPSGWQNDPPPAAPAGVLNPQAGGPKVPVLIALGVIAIVVIGFVFVKMGSNDRAKVPDKVITAPPAGSVVFATPSTVPPVTVAPGWVEYRSPDGRFVAGFPVVPNQKSVTVAVGNRNLPAVEIGAQQSPELPAFAVETIEIPTDFPIPDAQSALALLSQHLEVTGSESYSANGLDGVRFTARKDGADLTGVVYVRGSRVYYLAAAHADPASFDQFAASFQLPTGR